MTCDNKHIFVSAVVSAPSSPRHNKNWVFVLDKHLLAQAFREICVEISLDMFLSLVSHQAILVWKVEGMELMKGISVFSEDRRNSWFSCVSNQYHSREFSLGLEKKTYFFFFFFLLRIFVQWYKVWYIYICAWYIFKWSFWWSRCNILNSTVTV